MATLTLRAKTTLAGALVAAVLSLLAALTTYGLARRYMLQQRSDISVTQVIAASRLASASLSTGGDGLAALSAGAQLLPGSRAMLYRAGEWFVSGVAISQSDVPSSLQARLERGVPARQRIQLRGEPVTLVGFTLDASPATWFIGVLSMQELARTLFVLRAALTLGVSLGVAGGAVVGWRLSRRVMEPLHSIGETAEAVSKGDLDRRVEEPNEPDLRRIASAVNEMTKSLSARIQRESRFGATVSHELKSPLTVIKGAAELIATTRDDLPQRAQFGSDLLATQIAEFEKILSNLIEINRYQSGTVRPQLEVLSVGELTDALAARHQLDHRRIEVVNENIVVDARRLEQIFVNLKRNADLYAGGVEVLRGTRDGENYVLHFDDRGVGVPPSDRERIFEPFTRGDHHSAVPGSGLGLVITREHARVMGGDVTVGVSPEGGARFTVRLRIGDPTKAVDWE